MELLLLGGTRFLGRHVAEAALAAGHRVTMFHRGRTGAEVLPHVPRILGDRDGGLGSLSGRRWDAVVDLCGYVPRVVRASAEALAGSVGRYLFVSTISVYAEPVPGYAREDAPLARLSDPGSEVVDGASYGALKALCESEVQRLFGSRSTVVRPGLIVGPFDSTDRFPYWPRRIARGGDVLAPGDGSQPTQFVDVRDLARFLIRLLEHDAGGVMHATGPREPLDLRTCLETLRAALGSDASFEWVGESFLLERGVQPWLELPLWVPASEAAFETCDISAALAAGLEFRPLAESARDTFAWDATRPDGARAASPALKPERESALLREWRAGSA